MIPSEVIKDARSEIVHGNGIGSVSSIIFVFEVELSVLCDDSYVMAQQKSYPSAVIIDQAESFDDYSIACRYKGFHTFERDIEADVSHQENLVLDDPEADTSGYPVRKNDPPDAFQQAEVSFLFITAFGQAQGHVVRASSFFRFLLIGWLSTGNGRQR